MRRIGNVWVSLSFFALSPNYVCRFFFVAHEHSLEVIGIIPTSTLAHAVCSFSLFSPVMTDALYTRNSIISE